MADDSNQATQTQSDFSYIRKIPAPVLLIEEEIIRDMSEHTIRVLGGGARKGFTGQNLTSISPPIQPDGRKTGDIFASSLFHVGKLNSSFPSFK